MKLLIKGALAALLLAGAATSASAQATDTDSATGSITIFRPITVTKDADLKFGNVVKGATTGTVDVAANVAGTRTVGGGATGLASGDTPQAAKFTVAGEGAQLYTLAVDDSFSISNGTDSITVTTSQSVADGTVALSGSIGGDGSTVVYVGGSLSVPSAISTGLFTGTFNVAATYN